MPQVYRRHSEYGDPPPSGSWRPANPSTTPTAPTARHSRRSSQPQPPLPSITDADDSIVLSDLIRTGETSRLRRRGAIHAARPIPPSFFSSSQPPSAPPPPRPIILPPSRSGSPGPMLTNPVGGDDEFTYGGQEWREWNSDPTQSDAWSTGVTAGAGYAGAGPLGPGGMQLDDVSRENDHNEQAFMLFCGGRLSPQQLHSHESIHPFTPSPLPAFPSNADHDPHSHLHSRHFHSDAPHTNGCGALVHLRAFPQRPRPVWVGKEEATDVVVSLEAKYFDSIVVAKMMKSACGCVREGIGCAICGNPLGTRYMPCQAASEGIFSAPATSNPTPSSSSTSLNSRPSSASSSLSRSARSPRPLHPSNPRYWNCRPPPTRSRTWASSSRGGLTQGGQMAEREKEREKERRNPKRFYVYTFFADRVSSTPVSPEWEDAERGCLGSQPLSSQQQQQSSSSQQPQPIPPPRPSYPISPSSSSNRRPRPPVRSLTQYPPVVLREESYDDAYRGSEEDPVLTLTPPPPLPTSFLALTPQLSSSNPAISASGTASEDVIMSAEGGVMGMGYTASPSPMASPVLAPVSVSISELEPVLERAPEDQDVHTPLPSRPPSPPRPATPPSVLAPAPISPHSPHSPHSLHSPHLQHSPHSPHSPSSPVSPILTMLPTTTTTTTTGPARSQSVPPPIQFPSSFYAARSLSFVSRPSIGSVGLNGLNGLGIGGMSGMGGGMMRLSGGSSLSLSPAPRTTVLEDAFDVQMQEREGVGRAREVSEFDFDFGEDGDGDVEAEIEIEGDDRMGVGMGMGTRMEVVLDADGVVVEHHGVDGDADREMGDGEGGGEGGGDGDKVGGGDVGGGGGIAWGGR